MATSDVLSEMDALLLELESATKIESSRPPPANLPNVAEDAGAEDPGFEVTAYEVSGDIDYDKLIKMWGCDPLTQEQLARFERLTGKRPHPMIRRGIYYAHRDFDQILDCYENGDAFYLYTGRGPSSTGMHVGHMVPFIINKHLQDVFDVPLVVQITDDEKFFWKDISLEESYRRARENIREIISFGFDITKTFIFSDLDYAQYLRPNAVLVQQAINVNKLCKIFGFKPEKFGELNVGQLAYPAYQVVPSFSSTFPVHFQGRKMRCLIPCAIDQDPYFRMARDCAESLGEFKTSTIYSRFICDLSGPGKMSSSTGGAIFLTNTAKEIRKKIKGAFSGAPMSLEEHREKGANLEIDVAFQYLRFFLDDDEKLEEIRKGYSSGAMLTSEVKEVLCNTLIPLIEEIQENRKTVTDDVIDTFMSIRPLEL